MPSPLVLTNSTLFLMTPISGASTPVLTPYSARGLTQTLEPIFKPEWLREDVNGVLRDISDSRFRKYVSDVSCRDTATPCIDGTWVGVEVEVECACELSYPTGGTPQRSAVAGSTRTEGSITFYRPLLYMMVAPFKSSFSEYGAGGYAWQFQLREIQVP